MQKQNSGSQQLPQLWIWSLFFFFEEIRSSQNVTLQPWKAIFKLGQKNTITEHRLCSTDSCSLLLYSVVYRSLGTHQREDCLCPDDGTAQVSMSFVLRQEPSFRYQCYVHMRMPHEAYISYYLSSILLIKQPYLDSHAYLLSVSPPSP